MVTRKETYDEIQDWTDRGNRALAQLDADSLHAREVSDALLVSICQANKDTEYGKKYHFDEVKSYEDYKRLVPLSDYDDYQPYIERMIENNEKDLITSSPIKYYAITSGSSGKKKRLPVTQFLLDIYSDYSVYRFYAGSDNYMKEKFNSRMPRTKGFDTLEVRNKKLSNGVYAGVISGLAVTEVKDSLHIVNTSPTEIMFPEEEMDCRYLKILFALRERDLALINTVFMTHIIDIMTFMTNNWKLFVEDIRVGKINKDVVIPDHLRKKFEDMMEADPERADELENEFSRGFDTPIIPRIWPNLVDIVAIGTGSFAPFTAKMRTYMGDQISLDYHVYGASEGMFACSRRPEQTQYMLIINGGYYEFIPLETDDPKDITTFDKLEPGKEYEMVLTNNSGLYRYRIKDVIRCTGYYNDIPLVEFAFRKSQMVSIAGEKMTENDFTWATDETSKVIGNHIDDYALYVDYDKQPAGMVLFTQFERRAPQDKKEEYRSILEQKMGEVSPDFFEEVRDKEIAKPLLNYLYDQTNELYRDLMIIQGTIPNQIKPVRIIDSKFKRDFFFAMVDDGREDEGKAVFTKKLNAKVLSYKISGGIDALNAEDFDNDIKEAIKDCDSVEFDLSEVDFLSPAALRTVIAVYQALIKRGSTSLVKYNDYVEKLFKVCGLNDFVTIK